MGMSSSHPVCSNFIAHKARSIGRFPPLDRWHLTDLTDPDRELDLSPVGGWCLTPFPRCVPRPRLIAHSGSCERPWVWFDLISGSELLTIGSGGPSQGAARHRRVADDAVSLELLRTPELHHLLTLLLFLLLLLLTVLQFLLPLKGD